MPLNFRWVGEDEVDRVALTRAQCFRHCPDDVDRFRDGIRNDCRARAGDFLLAELNGEPVGTATSLSMTMWVRGSPIPAQGVAFVGTIKTHRRRGEGEGRGIASQIMRQVLAKSRERGEVVSALMPFRGSFYEHFGYGFVERRNQWTVPLSLFPRENNEGSRFYRPDDLPAMQQLHRQIVQRGQCDIERADGAWAQLVARASSPCPGGFTVVDQSNVNLNGFLQLHHQQTDDKDYLEVIEIDYEDIDTLRRQLAFLGSLRDQYFAAILSLPSDLPLNLLLRETQLPHRQVNHAHALMKEQTRMQLRVLNHKALIEGMHLAASAAGKVAVSVRECEGHESRFSVEMGDGAAQVSDSQSSPKFSCTDATWAAIVCGDLPATRAVQLGLAQAEDQQSPRLLDVFAEGPASFSHEYF